VFDFLVQRAAISVVTLFVISMIVFTGVRMIPGDPARVMAGSEADAAGIEEVREKYGLKDPIPFQYVRWVGLALRGDLGQSIRTHESVVTTVATKLPITIELAFLSLLIAVGIAIPAGVLAAVRRNTVWDVLTSGASLCGVSVPNFWLGIMLILFFSVRLGWLPVAGYASVFQDPVAALRHMLLPAVSLGFSQSALIARIARSCMIEVLRQDYIRTARAKGQGERIVVYKHALRNMMVPLLTIIGIFIAIALTGTVLTETVFTRPGLGKMLVDAIGARDYPLAQGAITVFTMIIIFVNLVVDMLYAVVDPRITYR